MYKANDVIGLPVLDLQRGIELAVVRDVLFNEEWAFQGLLVELKTLFRRSRFIPSHLIYAIGKDCIMVAHPDALQPQSRTAHLNGVKTGPLTIAGKPVYSANGQCFGQVEDVYFEKGSGIIAGYEVSDGLLTDLFDGRRSLCHIPNCTIGEDAVVFPVSDENLDEIQNNQAEGEE